ncbi:hypothetical protein [Nonomuraea sp. NPDC046570]|uniref:hypothetical protein n=1 Tax=Nonomuraea sp. NPDC046570 TaxID=3155255 RepID=UPI00340B1BF2
MSRERVRARVDRSLAAADALRDVVAHWLAGRGDDPRFLRFRRQLAILDTLFAELLDAIRSELLKVLQTADSGPAYQRCRELDESLLVGERLFGWYREKYDQRLDDRLHAVLAAADEVVRSCWRAACEHAGRTPAAGPLPYLDARFAASATPRPAVPAGLRPSADSVVEELVRELPIPVIGLPGWAARESWWLGMCAHETGHHVHHDFDPGLPYAVRSALAEVGEEWIGWAAEAFADAYSAVMIGPAACWLVAELQHGPEEAMLRPAGPYPSPVVRSALLAELCARLGAPAPAQPDLDGLLARAGRTQERRLAEVPAVARALLGLPLGGRPLRDLGLPDAGRASAWAGQLARGVPLFAGLDRPEAARELVAAGVAGHAADPARVHANLVGHLPRCGGEGTLGASAPQPAVRDLARRLTGRVLGGGR